jgi:hypothetical protein
MDFNKSFLHYYSATCKVFLQGLIFWLSIVSVFSQTTVRVLNIPIGLGNMPRSGFRNETNYTLLQAFMINNSTPKLLNLQNFGPNGKVKSRLSVVNGFENLGSITSIGLLDPYDIIFIGGIGENNYKTFLSEEMNLILEWSRQPGNVLIVAEQPAGSPMTLHRGFSMKQTNNTNPSKPWKWKQEGIPNIFSGPFGMIEAVSQNGTSQGYFENVCDAAAIFYGSNNKPTMLYDMVRNDMYISDTDFFTSLNPEIRANSVISTPAEIVWGNLWAWAISEVISPKPFTKIKIP